MKRYKLHDANHSAKVVELMGASFLMPDWISVFPFLNLTGEASLTLTPERCGVIREAKYDSLREKIGKINFL